jgi:hypothetical protein
VPNTSVFINCPFDADFQSSFEALLFTITASGYQARCALEDNNAGDIRYEKLCRLVEGCDLAVHDLSRVELNDAGLPRFNMPFELGLYMGARRFGGKRQRKKSALIMTSAPYRLPIYLSDLSGNDPASHHGRPEEVVKIVRRYLHVRPDGRPLPGAARILEEMRNFQAALPALAAALDIALSETDSYREYRTHLALLVEYLKAE